MNAAMVSGAANVAREPRPLQNGTNIRPIIIVLHNASYLHLLLISAWHCVHVHLAALLIITKNK